MLRADFRGLFQRHIVAAFLHPGGQAHAGLQGEQRQGRQFLDIGHVAYIPGAVGDQQGGGHGRHAGGVGDGLAADLGKGFGVVADVVEEDLAGLAVLLALEQGADAGLAGVVGSERCRVGQYGLDQLQGPESSFTGCSDSRPSDFSTVNTLM